MTVTWDAGGYCAQWGCSRSLASPQLCRPPLLQAAPVHLCGGHLHGPRRPSGKKRAPAGRLSPEGSPPQVASLSGCRVQTCFSLSSVLVSCSHGLWRLETAFFFLNSLRYLVLGLWTWRLIKRAPSRDQTFVCCPFGFGLFGSNLGREGARPSLWV